MTFSEYASGLSPFISFGQSEYDYFTEIVGNFVQDAALDSCKLLKRKTDTQYRYIKGTRTIQPKDAQYLYDHRDKSKFSEWIWDRMGESDSYDSVVAWLKSIGVDTKDPSNDCADLLECIILDIINCSSTTQAVKESEIDLKLIMTFKKK